LQGEVFRRSSGGPVKDAVRIREIYTVAVMRGKDLGVGGRVRYDSLAKSLNTAQTLVLDKGKNLFTAQLAKNSVTIMKN